MAGPRVAVVIPTYNRHERLERLLGELAAQTMDSGQFEVVVVDDASTDGTPELLAGWVAADPERHRVIGTGANTGGPARPRNLGWRAARAPVIAFVDDDCHPEPSWLEAGVAAVEADAGLGVVQGRTEIPAGVVLEDLDRWAIWRYVDGPTPWFECANIFYRRPALEAVGGFDESLVTWGEDTDLGWRVVDAGWARGYTADAVVVHDIEVRGWRTAARFAWKDAQLVRMARAHPGIRDGFWRPWAMHRQGVEFAALVVGLAVGRWWRPAALAALPYLWFRRPPLRRDGVNRRTIAIGLQTLAVDSVRLTARLRGSIRAGILVL